MPQIKLTKNELRQQQNKAESLSKYLPILELKKGMLQLEVSTSLSEREEALLTLQGLKEKADAFSPLLATFSSFDVDLALKVKVIKKRTENIAGIEVPYLDAVIFEDYAYDLLDTPVWTESVLLILRQLKEEQLRVLVAEEKTKALQRELSLVSIRVNLFEKILIPRACESIKKIKIFLGDQQLAAVSRAKVAKAKMTRKMNAD